MEEEGAPAHEEEFESEGDEDDGGTQEIKGAGIHTGENESEAMSSIEWEGREVSTTKGNDGGKEANNAGSEGDDRMSNRRNKTSGEEDMPPLLSTYRADKLETPPIQLTSDKREKRAQLLTEKSEGDKRATTLEAANKTKEGKAQISSLVEPEVVDDKPGITSYQAETKTEEEKTYTPVFVPVSKTNDKTSMSPLFLATSMEEEKTQVPPLLAPSKIRDIKALKNCSNPSVMLKVAGGINSTTNMQAVPSIVPATTKLRSFPAIVPATKGSGHSLSPSSIASTANTSHMRLVQTADGRKLLLTNVVNVSTAMPSKPVILLSKSQGTAAVAASTALVTSSAPPVTPMVSANKPQTIILNPSQLQTPQPIVLKVPGINQPIVVRQQSTGAKVASSLSATAQTKATGRLGRAMLASTTTTAAVPGPRVSPGKTVTQGSSAMFVQSGSTTFKVVGKPVPVKLFPKVQKIAPKHTMTLPVPPVTFPSLKSVRKYPEAAPPLITVPHRLSKAPLPEPPAYLNIRVKEEPQEVKSGSDVAAVVKLEPVDADGEGDVGDGTDIPLQMDALLDVHIKEEATGDQSELLARDEQLREVLQDADTEGVDEEQQAQQLHQQEQEEEQQQEQQVPPQLPKFYIRTSEGKLVAISPEDAQAFGLNLSDKVEHNKQRLMHALEAEMTTKVHTDAPLELMAGNVNIKDYLSALRQQQQQQSQQQQEKQVPKFYIRTSEGKLVEISPEEAKALGLNHKNNMEENQRRLINALRTDTSNVLIPGNVNVKEFVSCHVSPAAEKTATLMKTLAGRRLTTNANNVLVPKCDTAIIGEFEGDDGKKYLKITIETEANGREPCNVPITPLNTYQCPFCARDFKTKDHVVSHIRIHTGERPYPCDVCGKRYRQRIDIIRHMRIHTGEKPFNCGLCNASFNQKSNLRSHMRIHTGERPVQCQVCGKGFSRNTHLKQHMKLHTGEKPYKCNVCHRPFRFKSGLQAHERIHTGLKPYACSLCGRTFTQIVGLIRHERTHAGEKPFRCQSCGKSFDTRDTLKSHVKKHTSKRPHTCDLCPKTFTDATALRCHRKKYHNNMLICVICLRDDFKDRIELREHLRAHERQNWEETPEGDLVPLGRVPDGGHFVSVNDTMDEDEKLKEEDDDDDENYSIQNEMIISEENHVEVELDPDDPMEDDSENGDDCTSDYELQIEDCDPLA